MTFIQSHPSVPILSHKRHKTFYKYLKQLSHDLKNLYETSHNCDFELRIGDYVIPCHRAILTTRSPWFALKIEQQYENDSKCLILDEGGFKMIHALLLYIYTGDVDLMGNLNIPAMYLLEAAETYDVTRLKKLLIRFLKCERKSNIITTMRLNREVDNSNIGPIFVDFPPITVTSDHGVFTWCFTFRSVVQNEDPITFAEICLARTEKHNLDTIHAVDFHLNIMDAKRHMILEKRGIHFFGTDCVKKISYKAVDLRSAAHFRNLFHKEAKLLMSIFLVLISERKVEKITFKLGRIRKMCRKRELIALSVDMLKMLKSEKCTDIEVTDEYTKSQFLHSYIIFTRTSLTREDVQKLMNITKNESTVWLSFVSFVYSGNIRFIDDHMRMLYRLAIEYEWRKLLDIYSDILITCATTENILRTAEDAFVYSDYSLMNSGLYTKLFELGQLQNPEFVLKNTLEWNQFILNSFHLDSHTQIT